jgi:hypothetical protein
MIYSRAEPTVSARQALYVTNADFERLAHLYRIELGSVKDRFASPDPNGASLAMNRRIS